jgi:protease IV
MPEGRSRVWIWVLVGSGVFLLFAIAVVTVIDQSLRGNDEESYSGFGPKIAVVELEGVIISPKKVVKQLKQFADDDSVKAIIVHVNSPGGGVAASEEIYREVKRIRDEKKKRIVASIESVGASGAYYIASASNKIYADKGSIVGSIGVIAQWVNYGELLKWAKLNAITMKAGEFKDTGNPAREMTPAERAYFQSLIDDMHTQFIQAVADGRHAKTEEIRAIADGKVWTGEEAVPLKLVDQISDFEGAVKDTALAVNISGEPSVVWPPREKHSLLRLLFDDVSDYLPSREELLEQQVGFYYLWK